jgi:hypothetical protein
MTPLTKSRRMSADQLRLFRIAIASVLTASDSACARLAGPLQCSLQASWAMAASLATLRGRRLGPARLFGKREPYKSPRCLSKSFPAFLNDRSLRRKAI